MEHWISTFLTGLLCFWAGYRYGNRNTVINHHSNYYGDFEKLIVNGELRFVAPQNNAEANQLQPTTPPAQNNGTGENPIVNMPVTSGVA